MEHWIVEEAATEEVLGEAHARELANAPDAGVSKDLDNTELITRQLLLSTSEFRRRSIRMSRVLPTWGMYARYWTMSMGTQWSQG